MKSSAEQGLYGKFYVSRVDHRDSPGGDRDDARYFVLDYMYDKHAREALKYYAFICREDYPELSRDLWLELRDAAKERKD